MSSNYIHLNSPTVATEHFFHIVANEEQQINIEALYHKIYFSITKQNCNNLFDTLEKKQDTLGSMIPLETVYLMCEQHLD